MDSTWWPRRKAARFTHPRILALPGRFRKRARRRTGPASRATAPGSTSSRREPVPLAISILPRITVKAGQSGLRACPILHLGRRCTGHPSQATAPDSIWSRRCKTGLSILRQPGALLGLQYPRTRPCLLLVGVGLTLRTQACRQPSRGSRSRSPQNQQVRCSLPHFPMVEFLPLLMKERIGNCHMSHQRLGL
jgi:hypothetical protein